MKRNVILIILIIVIIIVIALIIKNYLNLKFSSDFNSENNKENFLEKVVDQVYVINMDKDTKRLKVFNEYMKALNIKYKRVKGVHGQSVYNNYKKTKLNSGELGCLLSHINVMKDAIKNDYTNILIFEDDVIFHTNFHKIFKETYNNIISKENRFDVIYLGYSEHGKNRYEHKIKFEGDYYYSDETYGCFGFIINKNIFKVVLENYLELNNHTDSIFDKYIQPKYKCFNFKTSIVTVNNNVDSNTAVLYNLYGITAFLYKINEIIRPGIKIIKSYYDRNRVNTKDFVNWYDTN